MIKTSTKVTIEPGLIADLKKFAQCVSKNMATTTRDLLTAETQRALEIFYSWKPEYYRRHYWNLMSNSFRKYYQNSHGSIYRGGVELTPNNMSDIYRVNSSYVFGLVYSGHHGHVSSIPHSIQNVPPIMNPSPNKIIKDKRRHIISHISLYAQGAISAAKSLGYTYLH